MIIPIRIDRRLHRRPVVNYLLILANVVVFVWVQRGGAAHEAVAAHLLHPERPELHQFFTSLFLHGDWLHLIGNMVFLWVFGNAVNDAFGHVAYLAFYLAGGVFAGVGYVLLSGAAPVLGASGAIAGVTGAFLVLFPRVRVTLLAFIIYIIPFEVSALFFLLLQFLWNLYASYGRAGGGIAYAAHVSGYVYGIAVAALLLAARLLPRDVYDLLSLLRQWRHRRPFVAAAAPAGSAPPPRRWVVSHRVEPAPAAADRPDALRGAIRGHCARGDHATAAAAYLELLQLAEDVVLPLQDQLDVSNYLMQSQQYAAAADAYERFLAHYRHYDHTGDIHLMLGLIYHRYLHQPSRAEHHLAQAIAQLDEPRKLSLAQAELDASRRRR